MKHVSDFDEQKCLEDLINEKKIDIGKVFEIVPNDDINNTTKVRIKRPKDFEDEE